MYKHQIYVLPESWCEKKALERKIEYIKIDGEIIEPKSTISEELLESSNYPIFKFEEIKEGASMMLAVSPETNLTYLGSPIKPMSRILSIDGEDFSYRMFKSYFLALGFKEYEAEYASRRKNSFN